MAVEVGGGGGGGGGCVSIGREGESEGLWVCGVSFSVICFPRSDYDMRFIYIGCLYPKFP